MTLLERSQLLRDYRLFTDDGATDLFFETYQRRNVLSHGERVLIEVVLDLWNGRGNASFSELYILSPELRCQIFSLYQALCDSPQTVQEWIDHPPLSS